MRSNPRVLAKIYAWLTQITSSTLALSCSAIVGIPTRTILVSTPAMSAPTVVTLSATYLYCKQNWEKYVKSGFYHSLRGYEMRRISQLIQLNCPREKSK